MIQIGLLVGFFAIVVAAWNHYEHMVGEIADLKTAVQLCAEGKKSLASALDDQNASIATLKRESDERDATAKVELALAQADAETHKERADALLAAKPKPNVTSCVATRSLLSDYARERQGKKP